MSLFGGALSAGVRGLTAVRRGQMAGDAARREREREDAADERQRRMDLLRMAVEQSQVERNNAAAAKALAPVQPVIHTYGRTLPDTPEGRAEAIGWREANRVQPRGRTSTPVARASGGSGGSGGTRRQTATSRSVSLRSANGEAQRMAAEGAANVGTIRVNLREKFPALEEGEIQGIAQRAWNSRRRDDRP